MGQFGFFDADKRLAVISAKGDPLEMIDRVVVRRVRLETVGQVEAGIGVAKCLVHRGVLVAKAAGRADPCQEYMAGLVIRFLILSSSGLSETQGTPRTAVGGARRAPRS
jgi:hypothetical protein